jgi:hypothetical protein
MKKITLTQGKFALVDDENYEDLIQFKWCAIRVRNTFYAERSVRVNGKKRIERMHRRILGLKSGDGKRVDHINHDGLDNRNKNIRICTNRENQQNQTIKRSNNTSGYKGVHWHKQAKKWQAQIQVDSQYKYLGLFKSKVKAAQAYNDAAIKYFGEFANLNQINEKCNN